MFSSLFLADVFMNGVISVEFMIISLKNGLGCLDFGLVESSSRIPKLGDQLGGDRMESSVHLSTTDSLSFNAPTFQSGRKSHSLQFFVNDKAGQSSMFGIPSSCYIDLQDSSFRIDSISCLS
ncbi:hypothetical protein BLNAU_17427 [Blattamonas nauphoetae]|uniref:Uncharacterized protein n=1 Tax=Blattamonas nauphoetae TaxID=2049346 RepID=A0ABQ9X8P8_9EUKA|nr:hypothetical protein BLNAU_17427 [Blattamonas nauphoetae]